LGYEDEDEELEAKKLQEIRDREHDKRVDDIRLILETPEGVRFFKNFFDRGRIFSSKFNRDPLQMAHNTGKNDFILAFTNEIIQANPTKFPELIMRQNAQ
tara:strand:+ start:19595 stop:19894 length:300 start_codon:yes stop_codon:yes gene_type:complete